MSANRHHNALAPGYRLHWYRIDSILGQGGFGITYLATDTNLDQPVAVKEFLPSDLAVRTRDSAVHPVSDARRDTFGWGLNRFLSEARTLAQFRHPNIVRVYSVFEANQTAYMVMEYERGTSLEDALKFRRLEGERALLSVVHALMDGLELVHAAGFIHRDIKPDNIFLRDQDGVPVLLDFGSARQAVGVETRTLTSLVTPGYAPFEQYNATRDNDRQGPWTDIYSLAGTLYRGITGRGPIDAMARADALLHGEPDPLVALTQVGPAGYSERLLRAVDHALAFHAADRPQTLAEWRAELPARPTTPEFAAATRAPDAGERAGEDDPTVVRGEVPRARGESGAGGTGPAVAESPHARGAGPRGAIGFAAAGLATVIVVGGALWLTRERGSSSEDAASLPESPVVVAPSPGAPPAPAEAARPTGAPESVADEARALAAERERLAEARSALEAEKTRLALESRQRELESARRAAQAQQIEEDRAGLAAGRAAPEQPQPSSRLAAPQPNAPAEAVPQPVIPAEAKPPPVAPVGAAPGGTPPEGGPLSRPAAEPVTDPVAAVTPARDDGSARVRELLDAAQADLGALRLTSPKGSNAVERYRAVLALDAGNTVAREGLERVVGRYLELVDDALRAGDAQRALTMLDRARGVAPGDPRLDGARERIEQARRDAQAAAETARREAEQASREAAERERVEAQRRDLAESSAAPARPVRDEQSRREAQALREREAAEGRARAEADGQRGVTIAVFPNESLRSCFYPVGRRIEDSARAEASARDGVEFGYSYYAPGANLAPVGRVERVWEGTAVHKSPNVGTVQAAARTLGVDAVLMGWYHCHDSQFFDEDTYTLELYLVDVRTGRVSSEKTPTAGTAGALKRLLDALVRTRRP